MKPWLPQPEWFANHTTERALSDTGSFWHLYREALHLRRSLPPVVLPNVMMGPGA
ncbi:hypothetical protein [Streptomyces sp. V4I2]|uniref:hypothetical protein n=1 Tax=Streptomyces sp. V4I2 TaxID=3042280 RepID=UPI002782CD08|nr:hypothetical protein [Streptomyces sp. V4I2]